MSPSKTDTILTMHEGGMGIIPTIPKQISSKDYDKYAAMKPIVDSAPTTPAQPATQSSPKPVSGGGPDGKTAKSESPPSSASPKVGSGDPQLSGGKKTYGGSPVNSKSGKTDKGA
jgi:hypothetical protein